MLLRQLRAGCARAAPASSGRRRRPRPRRRREREPAAPKPKPIPPRSRCQGMTTRWTAPGATTAAEAASNKTRMRRRRRRKPARAGPEGRCTRPTSRRSCAPWGSRHAVLRCLGTGSGSGVDGGAGEGASGRASGREGLMMPLAGLVMLGLMWLSGLDWTGQGMAIYCKRGDKNYDTRYRGSLICM